MKAIEEQVGGSRYKKLKMQPIELITKLRCSFIQGNIIKYISRYKSKNGLEDLDKCIHYANLAIELNDTRRCKDSEISVSINSYIAKNNMSIMQRRVITAAVYNKYEDVIEICEDLINLDYGEEDR